MNNIIDWIKKNTLIVIGLATVVILLFFGKSLKRFIAPHRVKHRRKISPTIHRRRKTTRTNRRPIPRSVGLHKRSGKGYPAAGGGYIPFKYNKDGTIKKAQFVGGTLAAKHKMSLLRHKR